MPSSAGPAAITRKLFRRFGHDRRGSAAVEFALVATPFFALLFAIIETSIVFFAGQVLETGLQDSARLIFTHQFQDANGALSVQQQMQKFRDDICPRLVVLFKCEGIEFDVRTYPQGTPITINDPISGGNYDNSSFTFQLPSPGSNATVVARAYYRYPLYVTGLGYNIANIGRGSSDSKRLLAATAAFHVEP